MNGSSLSDALTAHAGAAKKASGLKPTSDEKKRLRSAAKALLALKSLQALASTTAGDEPPPLAQQEDSSDPSMALVVHTPKRKTRGYINTDCPLPKTGSPGKKSSSAVMFDHYLPEPPFVQSCRSLCQQWVALWLTYLAWMVWPFRVLGRFTFWLLPGLILATIALCIYSMIYAALADPNVLAEVIVSLVMCVPHYLANLLVASSNGILHGLNNRLIILGVRLWSSMAPTQTTPIDDGTQSRSFESSNSQNFEPQVPSFSPAQVPPTTDWTIPSSMLCLLAAWRILKP